MSKQPHAKVEPCEPPPSAAQVLSAMRMERRSKIALMSYPGALYYLVESWLQSAWFTFAGLAVWFLIALVSEFAARKLQREKTAIYVFITAFYCLEGIAGLGDGLVNSPCLWLLPLGPVLGAVLLGIRAAFGCLAASVGLILSIWVIDLQMDLPAQFEHSHASLFLFRVISLAEFSLFGWIWTTQLHNQVKKISEQNQVLEEAKDELEVAHESKSSFLATMSHEVRTPMNGILGTAQCLAQGELDAEQSSWVQIIQDSGQYLMDVLNAILDLSKIDAGKLKIRSVDVRLDRVFNDVMSEISRSLGAQQLLLEYSGAKEPLMIRSDAERIEQVLRSLVLTAIEWADNAQLRVELGNEQSTPTIELFLPDLTLDESGIEIFEDPNSALVGDTHESNRVALGMKLCHELVSLMDGEIHVNTSPAQGTHILWKVSRQAPVASTSAAQHLVNTLDLSEEHFVDTLVLVTDDNAINRKIAKTQLEMLGCQVHTASNGNEAIEVCQELRFDLILMDLNMPQCNGLRAAEVIGRPERVNHKTPIIAFTADAYDIDDQHLLQSGICDHLAKPFRMEAVRRLLRRHCSEEIRLARAAA